MSKEKNKKRHLISEKRRKTLEEYREYSEEEYDKLIVYLASGGIVITVGFINNIIDITKSIHNIFLFISWACFILSLLSILVSHMFSKDAMDHELKRNIEKSDCYDKWTKRLNWFSTISLGSGIIIFMIFVGMNLK